MRLYCLPLLIISMVTVLSSTHTFAASKQTISIVIGHENTALLDILNTFTQQTGYEINTRIFDNADLKAQLLKHANTDLPDVALIPGDFLGLPYLQLSEIKPSVLNKNIGERFKKSAMVDGKYLGIPIIAGNHLVLYYNKSMVTSPATHWPELRSQQQAIKQGNSIIAWSFNEMYWFIPTITAMQTLPLIGEQIQLNTPEMQRAIQFYWNLAVTGVVDEQCDYQCGIDKFEREQNAYLISGFWSFRQLSTRLGSKLGIAPLPAINGQPMRSYFTSHVLAFLNHSLTGNKREALLALANFMQTEEVQQALWHQLNALPVNSLVLNKIEMQASSNVQVVIDLLNQSEPMPNNFKMAVVWEAISIGFKRYAAGVIDAKQATELMQHLAEESTQTTASDAR
ncbi:sugar ABC transporter substrate-binding protein [Flavobacterium sp. W21_SRS_FM6]|uniref:sugar ABC transporter substrate-binding protein n=1 Tax=Flavobacterium sp. W21_SRS_FM6 TaxID=3240268 RepID=UPI003F920293